MDHNFSGLFLIQEYCDALGIIIPCEGAGRVEGGGGEHGVAKSGDQAVPRAGWAPGLQSVNS